MSNIQNAGPNTENPNSANEEEEREKEDLDIESESKGGHHSPHGDSDPTIKNH